MGIMAAQVEFNGHAPALEDITSKMSEICDLLIVVVEADPDECYRFHARVAFDCMPDWRLEVSCYRPGAVDNFLEETLGDDAPHVSKLVEGAGKPEGTETVYLRAFMGEDPTLLFTAKLALEALGGRPREVVPDEVRQIYGRPITASELRKRHKTAEKRAKRFSIAIVLMLPILIPVYIVSSAWFVLTLPYTLWRAYRTLPPRTEDQ